LKIFWRIFEGYFLKNIHKSSQKASMRGLCYPICTPLAPFLIWSVCILFLKKHLVTASWDSNNLFNFSHAMYLWLHMRNYVIVQTIVDNVECEFMSFLPITNIASTHSRKCCNPCCSRCNWFGFNPIDYWPKFLCFEL